MTFDHAQHPILRSVLAIGLTVGLAIMAGCANLAPVRAFADETGKVAAAFDPMPGATLAMCRQKEERKDFITPPPGGFDIKAVRADAAKVCEPVAKANPGIVRVAALLEQYADTLARLADGKLPDYGSELSGLQSSIDALQDPAGRALLPAAQVHAVISLAEFIGRLSTQRAALREVKSLLDQAEGFDAAADALDAYATRVHGFYVRSYIAWIDAASTQVLPGAAAKEGLAARTVMVDLSAERDRLQASQAAVGQLSITIGKMKSARAELRARLDHPDDDLWKRLHAFAQEVRTLRKQVVAAF